MSASAAAVAAINSQLRSPRGLVKIGGNVIAGLKEIEVDNNGMREADTFRVTFALSELQSPYDANWITSTNPLGVEVLAGFPPDPTNFTTTDLETLITGNADVVDLDLSGRTITLSGRDLTSLFIDNKTAEKWINQTPLQIAQTLAGRHGMQFQGNYTGANLAGGFYAQDHTIPTQGQTEWDLLCQLAQQYGAVVFVDGNTLYFNNPPDMTQAPTFPIVWQDPGNELPAQSNTSSLSFQRTLTVGKTLTVTVHSWNQQQKKGFSVSYPSSSGGKIRPGSATSPAQNFSYTLGNLTHDQALQRAAAIYNDLITNEMRMTATMPAVGPDLIDVFHSCPVTGTGTAFDQTYYPESIKRTMSFDDGYKMTIQARNHSDEVEPVET